MGYIFKEWPVMPAGMAAKRAPQSTNALGQHLRYRGRGIVSVRKNVRVGRRSTPKDIRGEASRKKGGFNPPS